MKRFFLIAIFTLVVLMISSCQKLKILNAGYDDQSKNVGELLIFEGKDLDAINYYTDSLKENINKYGEISIEVAEDYNSLGLCYSSRGDYDTGIMYYFKAENCSIELQNNKNLVIAYSGLSRGYRGKGEYQTALKYVEKEYNIVKDVFGESSLEYTEVINDASLVYRDMGDNERALELGKKALELTLQIPGEEKYYALHSDYMNIGHIYFNESDYKNAQYYFKEAVILREKLWGRDGFRTAESYLAYGRAIAKEDPETARQYFEQALSVYEKDKQYDYFHTIVLRNIAWSYQLQSNYPEAMKYAIQAYKGAEEVERSLASHKQLIKDIYVNMNKGNEENFESWFKENVLN